MLNLATSIQRFSQRPRSRRKLPYPITANVRLAQVSAVTRPFEAAQCFARAAWPDMQRFRPRILVGSHADLMALSESVQQGQIDLGSIDHAIFVLTQCGSHPLTDVQRVSLWQTFGVPLYEMFIAAGGLVLASECEAHDGWHVESKTHFYVEDGGLYFDSRACERTATGLTATLNQDTCPCGREGARLTEIEAYRPNMMVRSLAAGA